MMSVTALPLRGGNTARAAVAIAVAVLLWELGSRGEEWLGISLPILGKVPAPTAVLVAWYDLLGDSGYWQSWYMSFLRVLAGFGAAMLIGIPLGLFMALNRTFHDTFFPAFEVLRPYRHLPGFQPRSSSGRHRSCPSPS